MCVLDDHSRVRLQSQDGESGSDYINANFVDVSLTSTHRLFCFFVIFFIYYYLISFFSLVFFFYHH